MAIKIQINSLQALERLIGGDSELEVEVRNSVVQEFAKKHLKALAQGFTFNAEYQIGELIRKEIEQRLNINYVGNQIKLPSRVITEIDYAVDKAIRDKIAKSTQETVSAFSIEKIVANQIEKRTVEITKEHVETEVKKKLKQLIHME